jgi:hypothetical protein
MPTEPVTILDADNVRRDIVTDDVGGQRYQVVKLAFGSDGSATGVETSAGLPVTQATGSSWTIAGTVAVSGPLTDAQLRATAVPVSAASLPLPAGAATSSKQDDLLAKFPSALDGDRIKTKTAIADGADEATGAKADASASSDTGTFSVISLLKRLLTKVTDFFTDCTPYSRVSTNDTNAVVVATGARRLMSLQIANYNATTHVRFYIYDKATTPTLGTDVPVHRFVVRLTQGSNNFPLPPQGLDFVNGIAIAIQSSSSASWSDSASANPAANDVVVNMSYK